MNKGLFQGRMVVWFSCGASSAVAAKIAVDEYSASYDVEVCYCDTMADEHQDNQRFFDEAQEWLGAPIRRLRSTKYCTCFDVFRGERYIVGVSGAPCTRALKERVRVAYQLPCDVHVLGFTADEPDRVRRFEVRHPQLDCEWVLIDRGITKQDCFAMLAQAGIELPAMYRLGYPNNNCIGCVKGGMGYWNRIRADFPERFRAMAALEREIGATVLRRGGTRIYLDELPTDAGRFDPIELGDCGAFCERVSEARRRALLAAAGGENT